MTAKTKKPRDTRPVAQREDVCNWLKENDAELFAAKVKIKDAREMCINAVGGRVPAAMFRSCIEQSCRWFRQCCRKAKARRNDLTGNQWDRVKRAVESLLVELHQQPFQVALEMIRTRCTVNESIMRGLPERLQVWSKK